MAKIQLPTSTEIEDIAALIHEETRPGSEWQMKGERVIEAARLACDWFEKLRLLCPWVDHEDVLGSDDCTDRCPACLLDSMRASTEEAAEDLPLMVREVERGR